MSKLYSLNKSERLKSVKITKDLFVTGQSVFQYPLKCLFIEINDHDVDATGPILFSTTASKRSFKQAVRRNKIKRHIREAYRQDKLRVYEAANTNNSQWAVMYIYVAKNLDDLKMVPKAMIKVNHKLIKAITTQS